MKSLQKTIAMLLTFALLLSLATLLAFAEDPEPTPEPETPVEDPNNIFNYTFTADTKLDEDPKLEILTGHKDVNGTLGIRANGNTQTILDGRLNIDTKTATAGNSLYFAGWYDGDHFGKQFVTTYDLAVHSMAEGDALLVGIFNDNQQYASAVTIVKDAEKKDTASIVAEPAKGASSVDNVKAIGGVEVAEVPFNESFVLSIAYNLGEAANTSTLDIYVNGVKLHTMTVLKNQQSSSAVLSNDGDNNGIWVACSYLKIQNNTKDADGKYVGSVFSFGSIDLYRGLDVKESTIYRMDFTPTTVLEEDSKLEIVAGHKDVNGTMALRHNGATQTNKDGKLNINTATATNNFSLYFAGWYESDHFGKQFVSTWDLSFEKIAEGDAIQIGIFNDNQIYSTTITIAPDPEKENAVTVLADWLKNPNTVDNVKTIGGTELGEFAYGERFRLSLAYNLGKGAEDSTVDVYIDGVKVHTFTLLKNQQGASQVLSNDGDKNGIFVSCAYLKFYTNTKANDVYVGSIVNIHSVDIYKGATVKESTNPLYHAYNEVVSYIDPTTLGVEAAATVNAIIKSVKDAAGAQVGIGADIAAKAKTDIDTAAIVDYRKYANTQLETYFDTTSYSKDIVDIVNGYVTEGKAAVEAATTIAAVNEAAAAAKAKIDTDLVGTLKTTLKAGLDDLVATIKGIAEASLNRIQETATAAKGKIDAASSIEEAVKVNEEAIAELNTMFLQAQFDAAAAEIDGYINLDSYSKKDQAAFLKEIAKAKEALNALTSAEGLDKIVADAKAALDQVKAVIDAAATTEAQTPETNAPTDGTGAGTQAPATNEPEGGCQSVVAGAWAMIVMLAGAVALKKKKD